MTLSRDDHERESLLRPSSPAEAAAITPSAAIDITSTATTTTSEQTPLLATAPDNDTDAASPNGPLPSKAFRHKVTLLCALFIFIVDLAVFLMEPPSQEILEDIICRTHYPDHRLASFSSSGSDDLDRRCKDPEVQKMMAAVKSLTSIPQLLIPILVQVPYGRVADTYGRRLVIRLAILGVTLMLTANIVVLALPDVFSVWLMAPAGLFLLVGGGPTMVTAMIWTMLADVTPVAERASVFYLLMALALILSATLTPLAGWLMTFTPWLPLWIGFAVCWVGTATSFLLPETSAVLLRPQRTSAPEPPDEDDEPVKTTDDNSSNNIFSSAWTALRRDAHRVYAFTLSSRRITALALLTALHHPFLVGMVVYGLQYMTARFAWSWTRATYVVTVSRVTSVALLLAGLPLATTLMARCGVSDPFRRDLYLLRASATLLCIGCLLFGLAPDGGTMVASQIVYGMSLGYSAQARALVTALVEPHMLATLNTALATLEGIMDVVAAFGLGWLLTKGLELGGELEGLPYLVLGGVALLAVITAFVIRPPNTKQQTGGA